MRLSPVSGGPAAGPKRVFIVGCPRSGTTLVQSMLASHPAVFSFPETHFFRKVWGRLWPVRALGVVSPRAAAKTLDSIAAEVGAMPERSRISRYWPSFTGQGRTFTEILDGACAEAGRSCWVEKSPIHLHCLDRIVRVVPEARFVHVVRDGKDVVASIYDLCKRDPGRWLGQMISRGVVDPRRRTPSTEEEILMAIVRRWNGDVRRTLAVAGDPRHHVLLYEGLISDPAGTMRALCAFLGLEFDEAMLRHQEAAEIVIGWRAGMPHMRGALEALRADLQGKFQTVLNGNERVWVEEHLMNGGRVERLFEGSMPTSTGQDKDTRASAIARYRDG